MMTGAADAAEIAEHYRLQGWSGQALNQRLRKHARILASCDPDVSKALLWMADCANRRIK